MASKFQFITELYSRTLTKLTGDYESWTGFLRAACYNYKCPFDEQVLIYAQRPNATAVLELEKWNRRFGRWVNAGATGIAVMDEAHGKGRLKHYFDITDTHATRISRPVPIWSMEPAYTEPVIETLEATFGTLPEKDNLPDAILSASRNAVADNVPDYLRDLLDCRDGSMLEELDMLNAEVTYRRALQSSVAYMLMTRLSLPAMAYLLPEDFEGIYSFDTPTTINALGIATSDIAEMGLREISRTVMQARREQFFAKDAQIGYDAVKEQNNAEKKGARNMEVTYRIQEGFRLPNLMLPQEPSVHLGKYAELRRQYLKQHRRVLYTNLKTSGKLATHLAEIEESAQRMVTEIVTQTAQAEGVTEDLKAADPQRWTGLMNNLRHSAEELVLSDLIYN
ncbi:MAG: TnpV protein [Vescimonas sp.]